MQERLQKILSACGTASRREAESLILAGRVTVNGLPAALGQKADLDADQIEVDGALLKPPEKRVCVLLHKPRGYACTCRDEKGRKTVLDLVAGCPFRLYPVGRLDMDSEGLLLLTNDGALANRVMHPAAGKEKVYLVWARGWRPEAEAVLRGPMALDGRPLAPVGLEIRREAGEDVLLEFTLREGRNRQIRRMCELAGLRVTRLKRTAEGPIRLGDLARGQWRYLTEEEIHALLGAAEEK